MLCLLMKSPCIEDVLTSDPHEERNQRFLTLVVDHHTWAHICPNDVHTLSRPNESFFCKAAAWWNEMMNLFDQTFKDESQFQLCLLDEEGQLPADGS